MQQLHGSFSAASSRAFMMRAYTWPPMVGGLTGGSSLSLSLPLNWCQESQIFTSCEVTCSESSRLSLIHLGGQLTAASGLTSSQLWCGSAG